MIKKVYIDEETTGTDPHRHGIIQIAMQFWIDREPVEEPLVLRLQPFKTDAIAQEALDVNGISELELFAADRLTPQEGFKQATAYLAKRIDKYDKVDKAFFVGFRAQFDSDFFRAFMGKNGDTYYGSWFYTPPLDVMMLAGYLLQRWRHKMVNFKLKTVYEFLHPELAGKWTEEDWHDAMFDIARTIDIENRLRYVAAGLWTPETGFKKDLQPTQP